MSQKPMNETHAFLGRGWSFPPLFHPSGKRVEMLTDVENIEKSIRLLFATQPGERTMRHDYGCNLSQYAFTELTLETITQIKGTIANAINFYEKRITLDKVEVAVDQNELEKLIIDLSYTVLSSNSRYNMVFPFYLHEAQSLDF